MITATSATAAASPRPLTSSPVTQSTAVGVPAGAGSAAEHPDLVVGGQEPVDHAAAEGAAAAGDQHRLAHGDDLPVRKLDSGR